MKHLYLTNRFFWLLGTFVLLFAGSFAVSLLFPLLQALFLTVVALILLDYGLLFNKNVQIKAVRALPKLFNLGDPNPVTLQVENLSNLKLSIQIIDELPAQFQLRNWEEKMVLPAGEKQTLRYELRPTERGEYCFGDVNLFLSTVLGLIQRRIRVDTSAPVPVYPSILQMKQFELKAFNRISQFQGIKKLRRIGHSYEFEQIKPYVRGDDYRSINWKASSRGSQLMVNQYEDERAQQVYSIIDKSRAMHLPFAGLSLMDYAINTSLVISNIALQKYDRAGLITFSDKIGATIKADNQPTQLNKILQALYKEKERLLESNYELLYHGVRKLINRRSLLLLYTNFESQYALERVLPLLRRMNTFHLLVVIFFENTELRQFAYGTVQTLEEIYRQTIAQKFLAEKAQMVHTLHQYGIQAVLTAPEDLSINTINKYLELKAKGLI
jgi:uncharacterized protein (DUF58 family)